MRFLLLRYGRRWLWIALGVAVILAGVGVAAADLRWAIAALMILFLAIPMILSLVLINHSLDPDVAFNALPHSVATEEDGLCLTVYRAILEEQPETDHPDSATSDATDNDQDEDYPFSHKRKKKKKPKTKKTVARLLTDYSSGTVRRIPFSQLRPYFVGSDFIAIPFADKGVLFIPREALPSSEEYQGFIMSISTGMTRSQSPFN